MVPVYIDPVARLGSQLLEVEKPARYTGGEYGCLAKKNAILNAVISFPDLYEIGMSNQAFRIIYRSLNAIEGISCDRAFAPAPDFEALLSSAGVPLYGLDTGIALNTVDIFCCTIGYELGITGVLSMLAASAIPLRAPERGREHPLVILGGPCVSNPLPYSLFADACWIGEAEAGFFDLCKELLQIKKQGGGRRDMLNRLLESAHIWAPGKRARRAVYSGFGTEAAAAVYPIPSIKTVQHHGAVEIMRGCPNGCRFCHAGIWYRPMRQKNAALVMEEVKAWVGAGYREISLSSLSTGDYCGIESLTASLNAIYGKRHVSFQLPSLKVSSFSLPLLETVSEVRKSGLTFAVETPLDLWQMGINKIVSLDQITAIVDEAKRRGWRRVKFYFMIGLPPAYSETAAGGDMAGSETSEEGRITAFVEEAARRTGLHFNINVGVFVPKPHTPYQWSAQLESEAAAAKLRFIRERLKSKGHKVNTQDPFISTLEGIISRGDERAGELAEKAFLRGCRLDAWSEFFKKEIWLDLFAEMNTLITDTLGIQKKLPWVCVESGTTLTCLETERQYSEQAKITSPCIENCTHQCGVCGKNQGIVQNSAQGEVKSALGKDGAGKNDLSGTWRVIFSFSKTGKAVFVPHLSVMEIFYMAFQRAGVPAAFTQGFNPLPHLDIASPLALGITGLEEIAAIDLEVPISPESFVTDVNGVLPEGFTIIESLPVLIPGGAKKYSVSSLLWGVRYHGTAVPFSGEKAYRKELSGGLSNYGLVREGVLAKNPTDNLNPDSYFEVYKKLYGEPVLKSL